MSIISELKNRLLKALGNLSDNPTELLNLVRRSQEPKFGDYQANFAMPLGKRLGRSPREVADEIIDRIDVDDICHHPEVAGPGFINLRVRDDWLAKKLGEAVGDPRLFVAAADKPRSYVVDFSAPNVAKPMHVGHIRSTVIGDSICHILRFLGHNVISDNHIGDWGTQFGMIIYGYRHFCNEDAYLKAPVEELARLYRLVRQLADYQQDRDSLPELRHKIEQQQLALVRELEEAHGELDKKTKKSMRRTEANISQAKKELESIEARLAQFETDPTLARLSTEHADIVSAAQLETAKLHAGDEENLKLWREFLPACEDEIQRVYERLSITFDYTLGESFYNDRLASVVEDLIDCGIARESDGAICVFIDGQSVPMIIRKRDGAFLYATTDLATIEYRMENWRPDAILYVVDHRQSMHFENLFAAARMIGHDKVELQHVSFGTVLGEDGRPFKTRSGDTVGLEGLLDEAVERATKIVEQNSETKLNNFELSDKKKVEVAERVGIAALKYADLSQNRTSDYVFSYDKMLAMNGNTATYMQYAYARVRSIFALGNVNVESLRSADAKILLNTPAERALGLEILRFGEALELSAADYRPNHLTNYLFDLAGKYSSFFEQCPVLKAESTEIQRSRLLLCDLTACVIKKGLELLGIDVVEKM